MTKSEIKNELINPTKILLAENLLSLKTLSRYTNNDALTTYSTTLYNMQYRKKMYKSLLKTSIPIEAKRIRKENIKTIPPIINALNKFGFKDIIYFLNYYLLQDF